ncbi:hypothetical protein NIES4071_110120 (plasmid) [Calothrix sp. NIES-4071]|nr:hypothetical protein NIES4071_110120 [Calothrix sp. NIES-4071]
MDYETVRAIVIRVMNVNQGAEEFDKLFIILDKIKGAKSRKERGQGKTNFTQNYKRLVKKYGLEEARKFYLNALGLYLLEEPDNKYLKFLVQRIEPKPGYYFQGEGATWGWYSETQTMAEKLPLFLTPGFVHVDFSILYKDKELWNQRGFYEAETFPYDNNVVDEDGKPYLLVFKNAKEYGFWRAYQWWEGCRDWYYKKHPEWFEDEG